MSHPTEPDKDCGCDRCFDRRQRAGICEADCDCDRCELTRLRARVAELEAERKGSFRCSIPGHQADTSCAVACPSCMVEAREKIRRLEEAAEAHAWEISPAMAQAKIDELNRALDQARATNTRLSRRCQEAEAALPEWHEIQTSGFKSGRFYGALLVKALADARADRARDREAMEAARYAMANTEPKHKRTHCEPSVTVAIQMLTARLNPGSTRGSTT